MRSRLLALPLVCTLLLAACGGDDAADAGPDPASLTPPDAPLYVEAVVRPEGDQRDDVLDALGKVLVTEDPQARLRELFDEATGEQDVDYDEDIGPWLGERVGVWARDFQSEEPGFAVIAAATDTERALETLEASGRREGTELEERSHGGTDYLFDPSDRTGLAAVEDFVVIATEPELQRTIDTAGEDALAGAERFTALTDELPDERLGTFFVDQRPLFEAAIAEQPGSEGQLLNSLFDPTELQPVAGALLADGDRIAIDSVGRAGGGGLVSRLGALTGQPTELLGELPADAWAAAGFSDLGETVRTLFTQVAGALGGAAIEGQFRQQTGLDLQEDLLAWMGDVAVYVSGVGREELRGAMVVEITDAERARNAFGRIVELARAQATGAEIADAEIEGAEAAVEVAGPGLPDVLVLAHNEERLVLALGRAGAESVLGGGDQLADSELWERGGALLGDGMAPAFLLDMGRVLENVDAFGAGREPDFRRARPYLEAYDVVASGGEAGDEQQTGRFAAGLR
jgi:hypothetical protein